MSELNLQGLSFGRLVVLSKSERENGRTAWLCRCICGNTKISTTHDLRDGSVKSCGCLKKDNMSLKTHGDSNSSEYKAWIAMKDRCYGINHSSRKLYYDRGIIVCDRWINSYENFLEDMGRKPCPSFTLDRIDNNGNYSPENCRWATIKQQNNNSRNCRFIEYLGHRRTMKEWSEKFNIGYHLLRDRLDILNWSIEKALTTPTIRIINKK